MVPNVGASSAACEATPVPFFFLVFYYVFGGMLVSARAMSLVQLPMVAMFDSVLNVFATGPPLKVVDVVVCFISVQVAGFHSFWTLANEGFKYEAMDVPPFPLVILPEGDA